MKNQQFEGFISISQTKLVLNLKIDFIKYSMYCLLYSDLNQ